MPKTNSRFVLYTHIVFGLLVFSGCGPNSEQLQLTSIPITQTVRALDEQSYERCLSNAIDLANEMSDEAMSCSNYDCRVGIYSGMVSLANSLSQMCSKPPTCSSEIQQRASKAIIALAALTQGAAPDLTSLEAYYYEEELFDSWRLTTESYLESSCKIN